MATYERRPSWEFLDFLRVTAVDKVAARALSGRGPDDLAARHVGHLDILRELADGERGE
jgi:hypothetical protein